LPFSPTYNGGQAYPDDDQPHDRHPSPTRDLHNRQSPSEPKLLGHPLKVNDEIHLSGLFEMSFADYLPAVANAMSIQPSTAGYPRRVTRRKIDLEDTGLHPDTTKQLLSRISKKLAWT